MVHASLFVFLCYTIFFVHDFVLCLCYMMFFIQTFSYHEYTVLVLQCKMPRYNEHCNHDYHNSDTSSRTKLYVGSISTDAREQDLEAAFSIYGRWGTGHILVIHFHHSSLDVVSDLLFVIRFPRVQRVFLHPDNYGFVLSRICHFFDLQVISSFNFFHLIIGA